MFIPLVEAVTVMIEVEQKFRVGEFGPLIAALQRLGAVEETAQSQADEYFAHPARDFAKTDEALRLRRVGEQNFVTYKGPKLAGPAKSRRELELPLEPGEAGAARFRELLEALGFGPVAVVEKRRRRWRLDYRGYLVEACCDEVARLGRFAELEILVDENDRAAAQSCLAHLAEQLELGRIERRSYLELLLSDSPQIADAQGPGEIP